MRVRNIVTGLIAAALLSVPCPAAAAAAPPCTGAGCVNKDPVTTGCDKDGRPIAEVWYRDRLLQGYYSPSCKAKWATVIGAPLNRRIYVRNSDGSPLFANMIHHVVWTKMVDGTLPAEACFENSSVCARPTVGQALF
ncbi:DUF2690 domain-containing protein [Nonomuraea typhae]|uniref:DUF2690 domain-containing protein n=1 Tax=Nonomuraea typhae TaxID=2603600 RepID=UPI0012F7AED9|nr:DUF2690 domain-containing protein [Nonomuraea typhae]